MEMRKRRRRRWSASRRWSTAATHVEIEVFDEPEVAAAKHRAGLRRLVALQIREPLKYLEKNIPDLQQMAAAVHGAGRHAGGAARADRRRGAGPRLPGRAAARPTSAAFKARVDEGARAAEPDRAGGRAAGRRGAGRVRRGAAQAQGQPAAEGRGRRHRRAAAAAGAQALPAPTRLDARCSTCRAT
ncbi:MAG: DUF3418 domain-containing protein [Comamonadaceae bacterium]|nr:DUF3418 domain-containing protein [Comamonadaceae bacterium]